MALYREYSVARRVVTTSARVESRSLDFACAAASASPLVDTACHAMSAQMGDHGTPAAAIVPSACTESTGAVRAADTQVSMVVAAGGCAQPEALPPAGGSHRRSSTSAPAFSA